MFGGKGSGAVNFSRQTKSKERNPGAHMQLSSPALLKQFADLMQEELFPVLESRIGPLSKHGKLLVAILSMVPLAGFTGTRRHTGRPPRNRRLLANAFLAKAVYNLTTTRQLLDRLRGDEQLRRLCGWPTVAAIPAESTFSRAFAAFAASGVPTQVHAALIRNTQKDYVFDYIARDATAIEARERFPEEAQQTSAAKPRQAKANKSKSKGTQKEKVDTAKTSKKGPQKGERFGPNRRESKPLGPAKRAKLAERGTRMERQHHMTLAAMLDDLPRNCSLGVKKSSKGHQSYWRGYKLHWDVASGNRIPISCLLTGASVHDSQVAIPLMEISHSRVKWRCDVMDSAYDAGAIRKKCKKLKHEALIQPVERPNSKEFAKWTEEKKQRYKIRTIVEQQNGRLKDEFGGRTIYVRGAAKVMAHLMFGVIALTVDQILRAVG